MTIEQRIAELQDKAQEVVSICDRESSRRVVYLHRAFELIALIRATFLAMNALEKEATPTDFNDDWRALRLRLLISKSGFDRILSGADAPQQPCKHQHL